MVPVPDRLVFHLFSFPLSFPSRVLRTTWAEFIAGSRLWSSHLQTIICDSSLTQVRYLRQQLRIPRRWIIV